MNLQEDIRPITYLKTHSADLIQTVNKRHRPVVITQNGEARAVLQDVHSFEATRKALLLLKMIALSETDVRRDRILPQQDIFLRMEKKLTRRG